MDKITIADLEVFYHVGVTEVERAQPQRLLLTVEMAHDFVAAQASDNLADTIDYAALTERLLRFGDGCHWELIETLASDIAGMILDDYSPQSVSVEVKKFVIPQARHVAVSLSRRKTSQGRPSRVD
jgi:7,8-dihydroneopterin aldolase/epimerase/oxygenase